MVAGPWRSEEDQRNAAMQIIAALPLPITHMLVVDGDESQAA